MAGFRIVFAVIAVLVASCAGGAIDVSPRITDLHNIDECDSTSPYLTRLLETDIYEPAKFLISVKRTINYPETGLNTHRISCIKVINTDPGNHGGYPEIVYGGIGSTDVQIRLTSQWGQPLRFRIEIWSDDFVPVQ